MYRLDLSDRRLALPVAIYEVPGDRGGGRLVSNRGLSRARGTQPSRLAFFAPDRPGIATLPVHEKVDSSGRQTLHVGTADRPADEDDAEPLFFILPDDHSGPGGATVRLYEYPGENGGHRYSLQAPGTGAGSASGARVLGRVWRNPGRALPW